ncbi:hypothetical protein ETAA8_45120 [Anatilimnocola aggregata]|uniref:Uncharacterized protein n=1 Tax=Anatilimnocola aggregata TaxID=2528021 RepID=A0A517YGS6_9BACT|nr:hypothetical protein ETAA8_45120 [Anatilimnocola aggregata]
MRQVLTAHMIHVRLTEDHEPIQALLLDRLSDSILPRMADFTHIRGPICLLPPP